MSIANRRYLTAAFLLVVALPAHSLDDVIRADVEIELFLSRPRIDLGRRVAPGP